ncbi:MAG TPA: hypothetical protein VGD07_10090 [Methylomirabilota bacterium]
MKIGRTALAVATASLMSWVAGAQAAGLVEEVRRATERFKGVTAATAAGYAPFLGCVSGPQEGAMGIHYVNGELVADGRLDPQRPEALMYETRNGQLRLVGVEYIVMAEAWNAANQTPPTLMGQTFHYTGSPNRYGLPAFYALHVWAWKHNPHGMFVDWNPKVSCEGHRPH